VGGGCGEPADQNARQGGEGRRSSRRRGRRRRTSRRGWSPWPWDSRASANSPPVHGQSKVRSAHLPPTRRRRLRPCSTRPTSLACRGSPHCRRSTTLRCTRASRLPCAEGRSPSPTGCRRRMTV
jgi:hypothetical protein